MKRILSTIFFFVTAICIYTAVPAYPSIITPLTQLDESPNIKAIHNDVRRAICTIKSNRDETNLPQLRFYAYTVREGDTFWKILARTSLDMDTLLSVNGLSSPGEVTKGKVMFIPNMRGVIKKMDKNDTVESVAREYRVKPEYIAYINKTSVSKKPFLFIPCGTVSPVERSLFLGTAFAFPLDSGIRTSGFGSRRDPFSNREQFHTGIDLACPTGSKVHAARAGEVIFTGYQGGYGMLVIIKHPFNYVSYYGHLSRVLVKPGQQLKAGDVLALSGNTGLTTGPHLHFEVRRNALPVNPGILWK